MSRPYQFSAPDRVTSPLDRKPQQAYPAGQQPSFKQDVNRAKTKKWVEAKSYNYDGDDYDDYDEHDEYGVGSSGKPMANPGMRSVTSPVTNGAPVQVLRRAPSFDAGDERRVFSTGNQFSQVPPSNETLRSRNTGDETRQFSNISAVPTTISDISSADPRHRANYSPTAEPPPLVTRFAPSSNATSAPFYTTSSAEPATEAEDESSDSEEPRILRPADIYRRHLEQQEKERQSMEDRNRTGMPASVAPPQQSVHSAEKPKPARINSIPPQLPSIGGEYTFEDDFWGKGGASTVTAHGNSLPRSQPAPTAFSSHPPHDRPKDTANRVFADPVEHISRFPTEDGSQPVAESVAHRADGSDTSETTPVMREAPQTIASTANLNPALSLANANMPAAVPPLQSDSDRESDVIVRHENPEATAVPSGSSLPQPAVNEPAMDDPHEQDTSVVVPSMLDKGAREADIAQLARTVPSEAAPILAASQHQAQQPFLDKGQAAPASEASPRISRAESPSKGRVADLASQFNSHARRGSQESNRSSVSLERAGEPTSPSRVARSATGYSPPKNLSPQRPTFARDPSFRPKLPGQWESYTTSVGNRSPERRYDPEDDELPEPDADAQAANETGNVDLTPTTTKHAVQARDVQPTPDESVGALASLSAAGAAIGEAIKKSMGLESEEPDTPRATTRSYGDVQLRPARFDRMDSESTTMPTTPLATEHVTESPLQTQELHVQNATSDDERTAEGVKPGRPPIVTNMSMDDSPGDLESDRLRKEIVRSLSPIGSPLAHEKEALAQEESIKKTDSTTRPFSVFPREYESYWNDDDATPASDMVPRAAEAFPEPPPLPIVVHSQAENQDLPVRSSPEHTVSPLLPAIASMQDNHRHSSPSAALDNTVSPPLPNTISGPNPGSDIERSPHANRRFSWEGEKVMVQPETAPSASLPATSTVAVLNRDPSDEKELLTAPLGGQPVADHPRLSGEGLRVINAEPGELPKPDDTPVSPRPLSIRGPVSPIVPEPAVMASVESPSRYQEVGEHETETATSTTKGSLPYEPKLPSFREIMTIKNPEQRIAAFNDTRKQWAQHDTGLNTWMSRTIGAQSGSGDLTSSFLSDSSRQAPTSLAGTQHRNSPSISRVFTRSSIDQTQQSTHAGPSPGPSPASQRASTGGGNAATARGKEFLSAAGVLGGKGMSGAKGLFAKGRMKLKAASSGGDKGPSPPLSPLPLPPSLARRPDSLRSLHSAHSSRDTAIMHRVNDENMHPLTLTSSVVTDGSAVISSGAATPTGQDTSHSGHRRKRTSMFSFGKRSRSGTAASMPAFAQGSAVSLERTKPSRTSFATEMFRPFSRGSHPDSPRKSKGRLSLLSATTKRESSSDWRDLSDVHVVQSSSTAPVLPMLDIPHDSIFPVGEPDSNTEISNVIQMSAYRIDFDAQPLSSTAAVPDRLGVLPSPATDAFSLSNRSPDTPRQGSWVSMAYSQHDSPEGSRTGQRSARNSVIRGIVRYASPVREEQTQPGDIDGTPEQQCIIASSKNAMHSRNVSELILEEDGPGASGEDMKDDPVSPVEGGAQSLTSRDPGSISGHGASVDDQEELKPEEDEHTTVEIPAALERPFDRQSRTISQDEKSMEAAVFHVFKAQSGASRSSSVVLPAITPEAEEASQARVESSIPDPEAPSSAGGFVPRLQPSPAFLSKNPGNVERQRLEYAESPIDPLGPNRSRQGQFTPPGAQDRSLNVGRRALASLGAEDANVSPSQRLHVNASQSSLILAEPVSLVNKVVSATEVGQDQQVIHADANDSVQATVAEARSNLTSNDAMYRHHNVSALDNTGLGLQDDDDAATVDSWEEIVSVVDEALPQDEDLLPYNTSEHPAPQADLISLLHQQQAMLDDIDTHPDEPEKGYLAAHVDNRPATSSTARYSSAVEEEADIARVYNIREYGQAPVLSDGPTDAGASESQSTTRQPSMRGQETLNNVDMSAAGTMPRRRAVSGISPVIGTNEDAKEVGEIGAPSSHSHPKTLVSARIMTITPADSMHRRRPVSPSAYERTPSFLGNPTRSATATPSISPLGQSRTPSPEPVKVDNRAGEAGISQLTVELTRPAFGTRGRSANDPNTGRPMSFEALPRDADGAPLQEEISLAQKAHHHAPTAMIPRRKVSLPVKTQLEPGPTPSPQPQVPIRRSSIDKSTMDVGVHPAYRDESESPYGDVVTASMPPNPRRISRGVVVTRQPPSGQYSAPGADPDAARDRRRSSALLIQEAELMPETKEPTYEPKSRKKRASAFFGALKSRVGGGEGSHGRSASATIPKFADRLEGRLGFRLDFSVRPPVAGDTAETTSSEVDSCNSNTAVLNRHSYIAPRTASRTSLQPPQVTPQRAGSATSPNLAAISHDDFTSDEQKAAHIPPTGQSRKKRFSALGGLFSKANSNSNHNHTRNHDSTLIYSTGHDSYHYQSGVNATEPNPWGAGEGSAVQQDLPHIYSQHARSVSAQPSILHDPQPTANLFEKPLPPSPPFAYSPETFTLLYGNQASMSPLPRVSSHDSEDRRRRGVSTPARPPTYSRHESTASGNSQVSAESEAASRHGSFGSAISPVNTRRDSTPLPPSGLRRESNTQLPQRQHQEQPYQIVIPEATEEIEPVVAQREIYLAAQARGKWQKNGDIEDDENALPGNDATMRTNVVEEDTLYSPPSPGIPLQTVISPSESIQERRKASAIQRKPTAPSTPTIRVPIAPVEGNSGQSTNSLLTSEIPTQAAQQYVLAKFPPPASPERQLEQHKLKHLSSYQNLESTATSLHGSPTDDISSSPDQGRSPTHLSPMDIPSRRPSNHRGDPSLEKEMGVDDPSSSEDEDTLRSDPASQSKKGLSPQSMDASLPENISVSSQHSGPRISPTTTAAASVLLPRSPIPNSPPATSPTPLSTRASSRTPSRQIPPTDPTSPQLPEAIAKDQQWLYRSRSSYAPEPLSQEERDRLMAKRLQEEEETGAGMERRDVDSDDEPVMRGVSYPGQEWTPAVWYD